MPNSATTSPPGSLLPAVPTVGIVGLGNWGTALANHLATKGVDVLGWAIEPRIVDAINLSHRNPVFLSEVELHQGLRATQRLDDLAARDVLVLVLPSLAFPEVVPKLTAVQSSIIVSATKGLVGDTLLTPLQYIEKFGPSPRGLVVLSGPSFAKDIVRHRPSGVVAASIREDIARSIAELFSSDWMKVYISTDPLGVELGGIVKNVVALAAGVSDGLGLGDSARAGLITRGLAEMIRLAEAMGADPRTLSGLSGLGDLVMTATCDSSRNRTVGLELGRGKKLSEVLENLGSIAEAVETTPHVLALADKFSVEMPITRQVSKLLAGEASPRELAKTLISRPMRREWD